MRIVYDASARATPDAPSLNDCLYPGPALQNKLWDVLIQQRAYPVVLAGEIKKAFLQIRIHESERDALRFHWQADLNSDVQTYRFTRVLFGLAPHLFHLAEFLNVISTPGLRNTRKRQSDYAEVSMSMTC